MNKRLQTITTEDSILFVLDGEKVGHIQRGDSSGTNQSGRRRVTWYGELNLAGFKRTYKPSGTKADVTRSIKKRIREWLENTDKPDQIINDVIEQMKADIAEGDLTAIEELLGFVDTDKLKGYLSE